MSRDIIDGFYAALPETHRKKVQFYPEFVNQGNSEPIKAAINKLTVFHNVDVISGIISYQSLPEIIPLIKQRNTLCFFFDMGEYLPPLNSLPTILFFNSFQFWQLEYALGNWAQKHFGGKGAILMSVYDAGYHLHSSFWQGAMQAGAEEIDMHVVPYNPEIQSITPVLPSFFEKIEKSKIDYLHVLFCGNEALEFFNSWKNFGLYKKIPLVVSPHMASDAIFSRMNNLGLTFYSATGWNYQAPADANKLFKQKFEGMIGRKATVFAVMGYEAGLAFLPVMPDLQKGDIEKAIRFLKTYQIEGPRGKRSFCLDNKSEKSPVQIEKFLLQPLKNSCLVVEQGNAMDYNHAVFEDIHHQCSSGWRNPYLCV
jgi:branched-chain amino acid transport system substrate-binding protein